MLGKHCLTLSNAILSLASHWFVLNLREEVKIIKACEGGGESYPPQAYKTLHFYSLKYNKWTAVIVKVIKGINATYQQGFGTFAQGEEHAFSNDSPVGKTS